ncbi:hypothetical protein ACWDR0_07760 [Streptomyces sp. NPDC003691]
MDAVAQGRGEEFDRAGGLLGDDAVAERGELRRPSEAGVAVTQPGVRPCIHSTNAGLRRPAPSVGGGAGRVAFSHRVTAAVYGPHPCPSR